MDQYAYGACWASSKDKLSHKDNRLMRLYIIKNIKGLYVN